MRKKAAYAPTLSFSRQMANKTTKKLLKSVVVYFPEERCRPPPRPYMPVHSLESAKGNTHESKSSGGEQERKLRAHTHLDRKQWTEKSTELHTSEPARMTSCDRGRVRRMAQIWPFIPRDQAETQYHLPTV